MEYLQITEDNVKTILELFDKDVDKKGFIIYKNSGKLVKCPYTNKPIHHKNFSILPGSAIFVNNDAYSFAGYRVQYSK